MSLTSYRAAPPRASAARARAGTERALKRVVVRALGRPGSDLLFRALRRSTIGAEGFHGRVRDGVGWVPLAMATGPAKRARILSWCDVTLGRRAKPVWPA